MLLLVAPTSTNYTLSNHSFGSGGGIGTSTSYSIQANTGEIGSNALTSNSYKTLPGLIFTQLANVPTAALTNDDFYYNKLGLVIGTEGNPADTEYAIAISSDSFTTTEYVQSDNTIGSTLGTEDWQTYADWGGSSGEFIVGLTPNTTYSVKIKARRGEYTEGPFGPIDTATTSNLTLSFDIDISAIDEETEAPYSISLGTVAPNSITSANENIWIDLSTNAAHGGRVYVSGGSGGLYSANAGYTISAVSADLSSISEGFGIQSVSASQSSGGPFIALSPYDGSTDVVGGISTTPNSVFSTSNLPVTNARGDIAVKVKTKDLTPAANDYTETLTFIAAALF